MVKVTVCNGESGAEKETAVGHHNIVRIESNDFGVRKKLYYPVSENESVSTVWRCDVETVTTWSRNA